ncbi:OmpA family protein [Rhizobiales bacterium RZME27]|uniref:OmpA family protein n=1 Tax=Endobacterium cereale TaxID=2663029 RepID=A0A6A8A4K3_9HYPH|nr:OmpA family protein [Endobacterium cereale]MEB2843618.1 OmpA family protein [Endobacterium cereale]MQY45544.1 OmpA family protein [Endobacterium cereale]
MSKKHRLMAKKFRAGVAMPVLSLSLIWQPAMAAPMAPGAMNVPAHNEIIRVQDAPSGEQPILPPGAAPQQEEAPAQAERPREQPPEPQAAPEPQRPEAPAAEPQAAPEPAPRAREPQAAPEPEAPRPRREAPAEQPPAAEKPAAEPPAAEQPKERPQRPERPARTEQDGETQPGGERPRGERPRGDAQQGEGRPQGERPRGERPQGERPRGERPAEAPQPDAQAPASRPAETAPPAAGEPAAPSERPARPAEGQAPAAGETTPGQAPTAGNAPAPEGTAPAAPGQAAPDQSGVMPGAAPAPAGQPAPGQAAAPPAGPRTPEEIERAKEIAKDPASATGPVVLPVENGAAILDSAKEYPSAPAAAAPGQPGQPRGPREGGPRPPRGGAEGGPAVAAPAGPPPPPPTSDAEAQALAPGERPRPPIKLEAATAERGERLDGRPRFERPEGFRERGGDRDGGRVILQFDNRTIVRHDDSRRFYDEGYEPEYERLRGGRTREIIERNGGVQIVTIRNRYGDVVQRSRIGDDGREYVLYYAPELMEDRDQPRRWRDPGLDLPPMRLTVPLDDYIIDTSTEPDRDYYEFLEQPPVERVERVYSLDEVRYSARIRDKVRRIDLDTITFATGSAEIPMNQASSLRKVADAIKEVLERDPAETFLIEGHTDAVGSDDSNLVLSDERAESVARVLTDAFDIAPENLATQGYGERYLKVRTDGPSQDNRRVTIRRITPLVKPVAQK